MIQKKIRARLEIFFGDFEKKYFFLRFFFQIHQKILKIRKILQNPSKSTKIQKIRFFWASIDVPTSYGAANAPKSFLESSIIPERSFLDGLPLLIGITGLAYENRPVKVKGNYASVSRWRSKITGFSMIFTIFSTLDASPELLRVCNRSQNISVIINDARTTISELGYT